jgi:hypothetical protein
LRGLFFEKALKLLLMINDTEAFNQANPKGKDEVTFSGKETVHPLR